MGSGVEPSVVDGGSGLGEDCVSVDMNIRKKQKGDAGIFRHPLYYSWDKEPVPMFQMEALC
ncbi:hypothetical protein DFR59_107125 [Falsibacillus pallidus]|uniref:Uncharacterized protein n=1 Tax=Falsibacillus pallidus TaxID=493781 RepID=A0A370GEI4_9BACI|nr:hypothetical protein DFR59_107125 [Falsibacillus pallidus]